MASEQGQIMQRKRTITTCVAAVFALALTACDDGGDDGAATEDTSSDDGSEEAAADDDEEAADADDADAEDDAGGDDAGDGSQPDDLPEEWPDELPIHSGVELTRVMVEEMGDGSELITLQYRTEEDVEESVDFFESLADHGWDVDAEEGEDGMNSFVDANLEGHGWTVSASFEHQLYTWSAQEQ